MKRVKIDKLNLLIDLNNLDEKMDIAIAKFIKDFFNSENIYFFAINKDLMQDFENEILDYLDRRYERNKDKLFRMQDYLFNNLTIISKYYLELRLFRDAEEYWEKILSIVKNWELSRGKRIHKGSIYYFWAAVALLNNELDKGFFLIHKAFEEDCITHGSETPGTPAFKTVSFNIRSKKNMLYGYVRTLWDIIKKYLDKYNKENNRHLLKRDIFLGFISNPPNEDLIFSFTYSIAQINQLIHYKSYITNSNFAGLYKLNILFDLVLIIDNFVFSKIPNSPDRNKWGFFKIAQKILEECNLDIIAQHRQKNLEAINQSQKQNFDLSINELLNKTYKYPYPKNISTLYVDLCICYCIRNHSAHNISLTNTISNRFEEIAQSVFNIFFLCIETWCITK